MPKTKKTSDSVVPEQREGKAETEVEKKERELGGKK